MKNTKNESLNMSTILIEAENTVESIKDQKLREIAFGKLLDLKLFSQIPGQPLTKNKRLNYKSSTDSRNNAEGPKKWISELDDEGFFTEPKNMHHISDELKSRSHTLKPSDLTWPLSSLCHVKRLRRTKQNDENGKLVWHWVKW